MTKQERLIVSAYTGVLMTDKEDFRLYAEKILGRKVNSYEFTFKDIWIKLKIKVESDFHNLCKEES